MYPLRGRVFFKNLYDPVASQQLNIVFELLGLEMLPLNLTRYIWDLDLKSSHIVARFCSVLQLATEMNSAPTVPSICPLSQILFWKRGQYHIVHKDIGNERPFLRITLDSRGVKKLERVETAVLPNSKTETYAILSASRILSMRAEFRVSSWTVDIAKLGHTFTNFGFIKFGLCHFV